MGTRRPAMSLAAVPGRRKATLEVATEIERRGFTGIYCPSLGDALARFRHGEIRLERHGQGHGTGNG